MKKLTKIKIKVLMALCILSILYNLFSHATQKYMAIEYYTNPKTENYTKDGITYTKNGIKINPTSTYYVDYIVYKNKKGLYANKYILLDYNDTEKAEIYPSDKPNLMYVKIYSLPNNRSSIQFIQTILKNTFKFIYNDKIIEMDHKYGNIRLQFKTDGIYSPFKVFKENDTNNIYINVNNEKILSVTLDTLYTEEDIKNENDAKQAAKLDSKLDEKKDPKKDAKQAAKQDAKLDAKKDPKKDAKQDQTQDPKNDAISDDKKDTELKKNIDDDDIFYKKYRYIIDINNDKYIEKVNIFFACFVILTEFDMHRRNYTELTN
jgi:hypothetical protein